MPLDASWLSTMQTQSNVQNAIANALLNQTNQKTPQGNLTYRKIGETDINGNLIPQFEAETTFSPEQQKLFDSGNRISQGFADLGEGYINKIRDATATPFSYAGMPAAPTVPTRPTLPGAPTPGALPVYDENYRVAQRDRLIARDQPNMDRDRDALIARLANQGFGVATKGSDRAWDNLNRGQNDFRLGADIAAGDEASKRYGLDLMANQQGWGQQMDKHDMDVGDLQTDFANQGSIYGYQGKTRDRAVNDALLLRSQPFDEAAKIFGMTSGAQQPQFVNTPTSTITPTDTQSPQIAAYQARQQNQQANQASNNALWGSIFGTAGSAASLGAMYL